ncbi:MAG: hypothetical protein WC277_08555 [Bacilli bacterium]
MTRTKRCTKCGVVKPVEEFHVSNGRPDGRTTQCKACRNAARAVAMRKARGPPRGPAIPDLHDVAWLRQRYQVELLAPGEIADLLGCNPTTVNSALRRAGIPRIPLAMRRAFRARREREAEGVSA